MNELTELSTWCAQHAQQISYACDTLQSIQARYRGQILRFTSSDKTREVDFALFPACENGEVVMHIHHPSHQVRIKLSLFEQQLSQPDALNCGTWSLVPDPHRSAIKQGETVA